MAHLTVYRDNCAGSTAVSNYFIDEYMSSANDAQIKIYLYLLRTTGAHQATSVCDMADRFNYTEKDVVRALKYWEKLRLLDLEYDSKGALIGIYMRDLNAPQVAPVMAAVPVASAAISPVATEADAPRFQKPAYSADQLRAFKSREATAQLLFIAETYIGKPLTPADMKTILFFTDELHFSDDLIDYLIQYCVERGKKDFKYIEKVAINWAEQGITTPEQAQHASGRYSKDVYDIVKALGSSNMPTDAEMTYITRWTADFQFSKEIILEACQRTVVAVNSNRYKYADKLLKSWYEQNVRQKADILKIDEAYRKGKKSSGEANTSQTKQYTNRFNQFAQNTYDFASLEKELLSN